MAHYTLSCLGAKVGQGRRKRCAVVCVCIVGAETQQDGTEKEKKTKRVASKCTNCCCVYAFVFSPCACKLGGGAFPFLSHLRLVCFVFRPPPLLSLCVFCSVCDLCVLLHVLSGAFAFAEGFTFALNFVIIPLPPPPVAPNFTLLSPMAVKRQGSSLHTRQAATFSHLHKHPTHPCSTSSERETRNYFRPPKIQIHSDSTDGHIHNCPCSTPPPAPS